LRDREAEIRYYRKEAGSKVAVRLVGAADKALDQTELAPGIDAYASRVRLDCSGPSHRRDEST
jgi:hypothetical protein